MKYINIFHSYSCSLFLTLWSQHMQKKGNMKLPWSMISLYSLYVLPLWLCKPGIFTKVIFHQMALAKYVPTHHYGVIFYCSYSFLINCEELAYLAGTFSFFPFVVIWWGHCYLQTWTCSMLQQNQSLKQSLCISNYDDSPSIQWLGLLFNIFSHNVSWHHGVCSRAWLSETSKLCQQIRSQA